MKSILFVALSLASTLVFSEVAPEKPKDEWQNTTLSDETIKNIQAAKHQYNVCVTNEMKKMDQATVDTRSSTETIIKNCEPILGNMRKVYTDEKIPGVIADRHLKQMRIQTTRGVLQQMMYLEAARKSGQISDSKTAQ